MNVTITSLPSIFTGSEICPSGITIRPSNPIRGISYLERSSFFKPSPLNRSRYITLATLPWSINTLFTMKSFIRAVTTKASSCGWIVPSRSSSLKAMGSWVYFSFFSEGYSPALLFVGATANAPSSWTPECPLKLHKLPLLLLTGVGKDSPEVKHPTRHPDS